MPRKTRVEIIDPDKIVARGDDVTIEAVAHGIEPREGRITLYHASGAKQTFTMPRNEAGHYVRTIANVQEPFKYVVKLNDGLSVEHSVDAQLRPAVNFIECTQIYPGYTGAGAGTPLAGGLGAVGGEPAVAADHGQQAGAGGAAAGQQRGRGQLRAACGIGCEVSAAAWTRPI